MAVSIWGGYKLQFFITKIKDLNVEVYNLNTIVVGSGAAGFNAADRLYNCLLYTSDAADE